MILAAMYCCSITKKAIDLKNNVKKDGPLIKAGEGARAAFFFLYPIVRLAKHLLMTP